MKVRRRGPETLRRGPERFYVSHRRYIAKMQPISRIKKLFEEHLEAWEVVLPDDAVANKTPGSVRQKNGSGLVRYVFGSDSKGDYLEYYSFHRIWGDSHARIYESGEIEHLDTLATMYVVSDDPQEAERNKAKMHEHNTKLMSDLEESGLLSGGPVPMSFEINAYLTTGDRDEPKKPEEG